MALQVAARLPRQGTKKNGTLAYDTHEARQASKGEASNVDRYPILDFFFFVLMTRPISAFNCIEIFVR
jgi:hypothetical protein